MSHSLFLVRTILWIGMLVCFASHGTVSVLYAENKTLNHMAKPPEMPSVTIFDLPQAMVKPQQFSIVISETLQLTLSYDDGTAIPGFPYVVTTPEGDHIYGRLNDFGRDVLYGETIRSSSVTFPGLNSDEIIRDQ